MPDLLAAPDADCAVRVNESGVFTLGEPISVSLTLSPDGRAHASVATRTETPRTRKHLPAAELSSCGLDFGVAGVTGQAVLDDGTRLGPSPIQEARMTKKLAYMMG